jgi:hypothetical protein
MVGRKQECQMEPDERKKYSRKRSKLSKRHFKFPQLRLVREALTVEEQALNHKSLLVKPQRSVLPVSCALAEVGKSSRSRAGSLERPRNSPKRGGGEGEKQCNDGQGGISAWTIKNWL